MHLHLGAAAAVYMPHMHKCHQGGVGSSAFFLQLHVLGQSALVLGLLDLLDQGA